jgi:hypothetical protein
MDKIDLGTLAGTLKVDGRAGRYFKVAVGGACRIRVMSK